MCEDVEHFDPYVGYAGYTNYVIALNSTGIIIGIVIPIVVLLVILPIAIFLIEMLHRRQVRARSETNIPKDAIMLRFGKANLTHMLHFVWQECLLPSYFQLFFLPRTSLLERHHTSCQGIYVCSSIFLFRSRCDIL